MPKIVKGIGEGIRYFFMNLLDASSTRVQIVWMTFIAWMSATAWAMAVIPIAREVSIIFYRQNCINAVPVNLDSPYSGTVLTMTGTAFVLVVGGYIGSNLANYKAQAQTSKPATEVKKPTGD